MKKTLYEYCTGCGLCQAYGIATLQEDQKGFLHPIEGDEKKLEKICPSGGNQCRQMDATKIWGKTKGVYYGWSEDKNVRKQASSGGVITEIAAYLLESNYVDAIIHTCMNPDSPTETVTCISTTRTELIERCGSRYAISHPLLNFSNLDRNLRYAFIGKPCDVTALKNYMDIDAELKKMIPVTISFFCAGLPSVHAQKRLLERLGCEEDASSLRYRGNGWPGYATVITKDGRESSIDYNSSWGEILGRDVMKMCRFCLDGVGEMADISCGDAWYLTQEGKPDFSEHEGRNVIFVRSSAGEDVLNRMTALAKIHLEAFPDYEEKLKYMQFYQNDRRATMWAKVLALKLMGRVTPRYGVNVLSSYSKHTSIKRNASIFKGTIKRILEKKI